MKTPYVIPEVTSLGGIQKLRDAMKIRKPFAFPVSQPQPLTEAERATKQAADDARARKHGTTGVKMVACDLQPIDARRGSGGFSDNF